LKWKQLKHIEGIQQEPQFLHSLLHYKIMDSNNNVIAIPSVCLPRVYHKFDANYIENIFCELFGPNMYGNSCVDKVDMISRTDRNTGEPFHVVFIHFSDHMYHSDYLSDFAERIHNDEEVKIQYNAPWFWKVRKNKAAARKQEVRTGPRIMSRKDEEELMTKQREIIKERNTKTDVGQTPPAVVSSGAAGAEPDLNGRFNTVIADESHHMLKSPASQRVTGCWPLSSASPLNSPATSSGNSRKSWADMEEENE